MILKSLSIQWCIFNIDFICLVMCLKASAVSLFAAVFSVQSLRLNVSSKIQIQTVSHDTSAFLSL